MLCLHCAYIPRKRKFPKGEMTNFRLARQARKGRVGLPAQERRKGLRAERDLTLKQPAPVAEENAGLFQQLIRKVIVQAGKNSLQELDKERCVMPQHITVANYNPEWPSKYVQERACITEILKDNCISIYHIGSTSVPGLAAKPIIDIMAAVRSLERVDTVAEKFSDMGYDAIFAKAVTSEPIKFIFFKQTIGTISGDTLHSGTICVPMKKSGTNTQKSKKTLHKSFPMI